MLAGVRKLKQLKQERENNVQNAFNSIKHLSSTINIEHKQLFENSLHQNSFASGYIYDDDFTSLQDTEDRSQFHILDESIDFLPIDLEDSTIKLFKSTTTTTMAKPIKKKIKNIRRKIKDALSDLDEIKHGSLDRESFILSHTASQNSFVVHNISWEGGRVTKSARQYRAKATKKNLLGCNATEDAIVSKARENRIKELKNYL